MSKRKAKQVKEPVEFQSKPDVTPEKAVKEVVDDILKECIKIEEGQTNTVYPLVRLVQQYKELRA